ncbi:MAG: DUF1724 domain-containing protein [Methanoregula sp.]|nr:DUF1724 domain-containing protein [Methanoregula sp.]
MDTYIEQFDKVQHIIHSLFRSRLQIKIIVSLGERKRSLSDLREITGSSSQAIIPIIRKLEAHHLIVSKKTEYSLTPLGGIVYAKIRDCISTIYVINNLNEFWQHHDLSGIPHEFLNDIGDLGNSTVLSDTMVDIFQVYSHFLKIVNDAKSISALSSIMSPGHADVIAKRVLDGIPVDLVVSADVALQLKKKPYLEKIVALKPYDNFSVSVLSEPLKLGLLVSDSCLSLGLYKPDGITYDASTDLLSNDKRAIAWGTKIFHAYKGRSKPMTF